MTIGGVSPVLEVPFRDDGSLDLPGFDRVVEAVLATGVGSVMFPGYASEFHKLTGTERELLTDRFLGATAGVDGFTAVVSVPDHATVVAVEVARRAAGRGAGALNLLPPYLLGPSRDAVLAHLGAVLDAVAPLPVVLQYAPAQTGTSLDADAIHALAKHHPNLGYVKVESAPPGRLISALRLPALVGYAGLQLPDALRRGAAGVQPGCSFTELYQEIWRAWHEGDRPAALALHTALLPYLSYWMQHVELIVAAEKEISVRRGWFASAHCRAPGWTLDAAELAMIDRFMDEFGGRLTPLSRA
ncbi:dihydrodipicolinate synthase family protein [Streptomyces beijiangensis]|uniref:Dihydrodipicolinate synthase family protein n=1 Tax=Streptomyces beijiangensis TaxID=163361 RepID=A0A939F570_9ACTN|nr:dihydrodipicolinate synthase family protein [Streptomyces beijiangensis]MBO0511694.1 dihydrodipicolinate synthase family protein [Streptomyces beijiangensis]